MKENVRFFFIYDFTKKSNHFPGMLLSDLLLMPGFSSDLKDTLKEDVSISSKYPHSANPKKTHLRTWEKERVPGQSLDFTQVLPA
jgi:hypothetical protein